MENMELRDERNNQVVKDNKLIQVMRHKYQMTVMQQKVLAYIISKLKPPVEYGGVIEMPSHVIRFEIRRFCEVCGISDAGQNYMNVKRALDSIAEESFWLKYPGGQFKFQWIVTPDIQEGSGCIEVEIPQKVFPFLWNLKERFTEYPLYSILAFRSGYTIMLFELCQSYAYKGGFLITVKRLREYLGLQEEYADYKLFRRDLLAKSVKEISTYTGIEVSFRGIRSGRKVSEIEFTIREKNGAETAEARNRVLKKIDPQGYLDQVEGQTRMEDFFTLQS